MLLPPGRLRSSGGQGGLGIVSSGPAETDYLACAAASTDLAHVQLARSINPSLRIGPMSQPCVLAPLLAAAQEANMCEARDAPDPCQPVPEDLRLLGPCMADAQGVA